MTKRENDGKCDICRGNPMGRPCVANGDVRLFGERVNHRSTPTLLSGSLGAIMAQYKSIVTKCIWKLTGSQTPVWQRKYYEHVIRNEEELNEICQYIRTNRENWENDKENSKWGVRGACGMMENSNKT